MILNVPEIFRGHLPKTKSELAVCIFFYYYKRTESSASFSSNKWIFTVCVNNLWWRLERLESFSLNNIKVNDI